uniref:Uncharacterized protein n=1 Tax=Chromera velia CCMP2878 TaxID=1169474 RepID=A0A0G4IFT2_9ALVE|eukprot:Cvel_2464.t1-p1 / transcript=Cvel_2464.t1 / gene=Cvel_2464 / organism=Chromera_velia_CCMP2878 / gene_product=hypothetical protein / transcript_product=hypothetical protein / location=Cvel_scaffold97:722-2073(-) / protein_length=374 / sequence_SO=supercontig / SO=protein_coding / is_pseudo=false
MRFHLSFLVAAPVAGAIDKLLDLNKLADLDFGKFGNVFGKEDAKADKKKCDNNLLTCASFCCPANEVLVPDADMRECPEPSGCTAALCCQASTCDAFSPGISYLHTFTSAGLELQVQKGRPDRNCAFIFNQPGAPAVTSLNNLSGMSIPPINGVRRIEVDYLVDFEPTPGFYLTTAGIGPSGGSSFSAIYDSTVVAATTFSRDAVDDGVCRQQTCPDDIEEALCLPQILADVSLALPFQNVCQLRITVTSPDSNPAILELTDFQALAPPVGNPAGDAVTTDLLPLLAPEGILVEAPDSNSPTQSVFGPVFLSDVLDFSQTFEVQSGLYTATNLGEGSQIAFECGTCVRANGANLPNYPLCTDGSGGFVPCPISE